METDAMKELIKTLKTRFDKNTRRHESIEWNAVLAKLESNPLKIETLLKMERTGGEPNVICYDERTNRFSFCDCSAESPKGRRSLCYDRAALDARKENKPDGNALEMASAMGIEILTEAHYRSLQQLGEFDLKTSSWIITPPAIRELGGALFCDRRYGQVFVYHNGADSYYAARGFRGQISI